MTSLQRRVLTAVAFIPLLIWAAHAGGTFFFLFFLAIMLGASWEFYQLMAAKGVQPSTKTGMFFSIVLMGLVFFTGTEHLDVFLAAFMIWITLRELFRSAITFPIYDISTTVFGVLYIGWLFSFVVLLREMPNEIGLRYEIGRSFVLYPILMAWGCDTTAYFFGRAFGKDKLYPRVSPKKSIQGAAAGFSAAIAMAFVGRWWFFHDAAGQPLLGVSQTLVLGALIGVASQLGDLVESLLKRDADAKDSSAIVPGHGGVMDVFDGLLFSAPVTYYLLKFWAFG